MSKFAQQTYRVGVCPACGNQINATAHIELEETSTQSPPDPRQEGAVVLKGVIKGAVVEKHDCSPRVTR